MKRFSVNPAWAFAVLACLSLTQCRKKDDGPSETWQNLQGTWRVTAYGADINENKQLDMDEFLPVPENPVITHTYAADGTGSTSINYAGFPLTTSNTWELSNADRTLKVVSTTSGIAVTQYYTISSLTSSSMILADTTRAQRTFTVAMKQ